MQANPNLHKEDLDLFAALKKRVEKYSASSDICKQEGTRKHSYDDHTDDHPKWENTKQSKVTKGKAYKEYYACATGEAAPKPKASARKKKGGSASSTTPPTLTPTTIVVSAPRLSATAKGKQPAREITPTEPTDVERTEAEQLKIALKRSRQETHVSQQRGLGTDEGTVSRPGVPDVPSDDSKEELSWNSSDDEEGDEQTKGREESEGDKTDESDNGSDDGND
nr:hypothetical protein [Tanacetum cinerariifolium]